MSKLGAVSAVLAGVFSILAFPVAGQAQNLISNGSFEEPALGDLPLAGCTIGGQPNWFYCQSSAVPGWTVTKFNTGAPYNLEFQTATTVGVSPTDLAQYAELSSHPDVDSLVKISQSVSGLCPLEEYELTYDAQLREPGGDTQDAGLEVKYDTYTDHPSLDLGSWKSFSSGLFYPSNDTITVSFADTKAGGDGTLGSFLDNVSLTQVTDRDLCDVTLDAKPGSYPNGVNLCKNGGVVPVAFVGTENFNPNDFEIVGVSVATDAGTGVFIVGKGKSDVCHIEDVVDGTNPSEITPDGWDDIVCQIPTTDLSDNVDTTGDTPAIARVCITLDDDGEGGNPEFVICAEDELKLARTCDNTE